MYRFLTAGLLACLVHSSVGCTPRSSSATAAPEATLAVVNARLIDGRRGMTIFVSGDRITGVVEGPAAGLPPTAHRIDAQGGLVVPGFHDAHIHVFDGAIEFTWMSLDPMSSLDQMLAAVADFARQHPDRPFIRGRGWTYDTVPGKRFPTRQMLDQAVPGRAIFIESFDGHGEWLSTAALKLAGIDARTPDPPGGRVVREADGKTPSGILLEKAEKLIEVAVPPPTRDGKRAVVEEALHRAVAFGLTSVTTVTDDEEMLSIYAEMEKDGRLPVRVHVALPLAGDLDRYVELSRKYHSDRVRFGFAKGYVDGVIEPRTAYMLEPYDGTTTRGVLRTPADRLHEQVRAAHERGLTVGLHACGDAAVRLALDTFERVQKELPGTAGPHRLEHIEVIDPADLPRFKALGIIASMQPMHANPEDAKPDEYAWSQNVGAQRRRMGFAWRDLDRAGATLAFGSDWPVSTPDPLAGIAVAMTRQDRYGRPKGGWNRHQAVDFATAVRAYSEGGARGVGRQAELGRLVKGQRADLVVLDRAVRPEQPMTLWPPVDGEDQRVRAVVVDGVPVHVEH